ncbi:multicopper oxidase domain-containing protein [Xanthobacter sp. AM11]
MRCGKNNPCQSKRSRDFWHGARWSETTLDHSHSMMHPMHLHGHHF